MQRVDDENLHPPAGENDEDDGGVAEHGRERDGAVEQRDNNHLAQLKKGDVDLDDGVVDYDGSRWWWCRW